MGHESFHVGVCRCLGGWSGCYRRRPGGFPDGLGLEERSLGLDGGCDFPAAGGRPLVPEPPEPWESPRRRDLPADPRERPDPWERPPFCSRARAAFSCLDFERSLRLAEPFFDLGFDFVLSHGSSAVALPSLARSATA